MLTNTETIDHFPDSFSFYIDFEVTIRKIFSYDTINPIKSRITALSLPARHRCAWHLLGAVDSTFRSMNAIIKEAVCVGIEILRVTQIHCSWGAKNSTEGGSIDIMKRYG